MQGIVSSLEDPMAQIAFNEGVLASHQMSVQAAPFDCPVAVLACHWYQRACRLVLRDLALGKHSRAAFWFPRALSEVELTGPLMLKDSRVLDVDLAQAVLAPERELCEHVPYHFVRSVLELRLLAALERATVSTRGQPTVEARPTEAGLAHFALFRLP